MNSYKAEIIVVGGGFTGVAAAAAAARRQRCLAHRKSGFLGGAATNCLVNPFMNYMFKDPKSGEAKPVNSGILRKYWVTLRLWADCTRTARLSMKNTLK